MSSAEEVDWKDREEASLAEKRKHEAVFHVNPEAISNVSHLDEPKGDEGRYSPFDLHGRKGVKMTPATPRVNDGLVSFYTAMRDAKLAEVELQKKKFAFEERLHNDLMRDREAECKQKAEECKKREKADMVHLQARPDLAVISIMSDHTQRKNATLILVLCPFTCETYVN